MGAQRTHNPQELWFDSTLCYLNALMWVIYILKFCPELMSWLVSKGIEREKEIYFKARTLRALKQTGKIGSKVKDSHRGALAPGKRVSKTGHVYWETRKNRSDAPGSNT